MQSLDIISINVWHIVISLANLTLLFFILKRFLFAPVKRVVAARTAALEAQYAEAEEAGRLAEADRAAWEKRMKTAEAEADAILEEATRNATRRGDSIVASAEARADGILREARAEVELERKKAEESIRQEIVDVSALLAEKLLTREIRTEDHRALMDSFIAEIGDADERDE